MKRLLLCLSLALGVTVFSGCSHTYVMKLNTGQTITTNGKPRLKGSTYYYKDAQGRKVTVPQSRVAEIAPASMVTEEKTRFKPAAR